MQMQELLPVSISLGECELAHSVFICAYQTYAQYESHERAIALALDAVWSSARAYQMKEDCQ